MNIRNYGRVKRDSNETTLNSLLESDQQLSGKQIPKKLLDKNETETLQEVIDSKYKQFPFDCGVYMASITEDVNSLFGLKHHYDITSDIDGFIQSVRKFIETAGYKLSKNDIRRLKNEYKRK